MSMPSQIRPPQPPFTRETALQQVRLAEDGLMVSRYACLNDLPIRQFHWPPGCRPDDRPGPRRLDSNSLRPDSRARPSQVIRHA